MWIAFKVLGCGYTERSQHDYFTKGLWICFSPFSLFHMKFFFEWKFLQLFIKNSCPNISHDFCKSLLNKYENFKMCKFCQILHFILNIYHDFAYQNILITSSFCFLYHKIQLFFACHAHYTPFTCCEGLLKIQFLKNTLNF